VGGYKTRPYDVEFFNRQKISWPSSSPSDQNTCSGGVYLRLTSRDDVGGYKTGPYEGETPTGSYVVAGLVPASWVGWYWGNHKSQPPNLKQYRNSKIRMINRNAKVLERSVCIVYPISIVKERIPSHLEKHKI